MNINQILSLVRDLAKYIGAGTAGGVILHSWFNVDVDQLSGAIAGIGAIVAFGASVWSQFAHTAPATVKAAAEIVPIAPSVQRAVGVKDPVGVVPTMEKR